jgi:NTP pyrophosphatase (non-canonical NTP hydrolase)
MLPSASVGVQSDEPSYFWTPWPILSGMSGFPDRQLTSILRFRADRDWQQFHTPRTLAASLAIESAELLEIFQWTPDAELDDVVAAKRERIEEELADVAIYLLLMAHDLDIDLEKAIERKLAMNAAKYPVELVKGRSDKYTDYPADRNADT